MYLSMQIAEEMKPSPMVIKILTLLTRVIPTWRIIPTEDIVDKAVKRPEWREEVKKIHLSLRSIEISSFLYCKMFCRSETIFTATRERSG